MILETAPLGFPWPTIDPFLFCVHHLDHYPIGQENMGPDPALLAGRTIGSDFTIRDGWRMYHGDIIPGFPRHPHRGFETVTIARRGFIDHSDSLGATARFGDGDCQWMTAGRGIVHAEMFPLLNTDGPNTAELFQIWLNLPAADKMVEPHFTMLWGESIPEVTVSDGQGRETTLRIVAGSWGDKRAPAPPPNSWAARAEADVGIWSGVMQAGAACELPAAAAGTERMLYIFEGAGLRVGATAVDGPIAVRVQADRPLPLVNLDTSGRTEFLMLQGRPIGDPVAHHGPFVMNTQAELQKAFEDYRSTQFGGWSWSSDAPVHPRPQGRFAVHADGRREARSSDAEPGEGR